MSKARNLSLLSTVEAGATTDQTKADLNAIGVSGGRKNLIINGGMQVAQRTASATIATGDGKCVSLDRIVCRTYGGGGRISLAQDSSAPEGHTYSAKVTVTTAQASGTYGYAIGQYVEGGNLYGIDFGQSTAKSITLSFWVKASITGTYCVSFRNSVGNRSFVIEYAISAANTWERKTITASGDTAGSWPLNTTSAGLLLEWNIGGQTAKQGTAGTWHGSNKTSTSNQTDIMATSGATFYLTGVQLELGSVATDFEHRSYGEELALCLRYFWKDASITSWFFPIDDSNNTYFRSEVYFPKVMRSSPSVSVDTSITGVQQISNNHVSLRLNYISTYATWQGITVDAEL